MQEVCSEVREAFSDVIADVQYLQSGATFILRPGAEEKKGLTDFEAALDSLRLVTNKISLPA